VANNAEVAAALRPENDWRTAYAFVELEAKNLLLIASGTYTTTELADAIYSPAEAHDPKVRKRVFQALKALATRGLANYVTLQEPQEGAFGTTRRKLWHAPRAITPAQCCPTCKRPL